MINNSTTGKINFIVTRKLSERLSFSYKDINVYRLVKKEGAAKPEYCLKLIDKPKKPAKFQKEIKMVFILIALSDVHYNETILKKGLALFRI